MVCSLSAQQKNRALFFNTSFNLTFRVNENFEFGEDNDELFLLPTETLIRFGIGYEFKKKIAVSFNSGFDFHFKYSIGAIPTYLGFQYNLRSRDDEAFFLTYNTGRLWRFANRYSNGDYKAYGVGWRIESGNKWNPVITLIYHHKKIINFEKGRLDNLSLGIGLSLN